MSEPARSYNAVIQEFGLSKIDIPPRVLFSDRVSARNGLNGPEIDSVLFSLAQTARMEGDAANIAETVQRQLDERWAGVAGLITFANSQLSPMAIKKEGAETAQRRAQRLSLARLMCDFVAPGKLQPAEALPDAIPDMPGPFLSSRLSTHQADLKSLRRKLDSDAAVLREKVASERLAAEGISEGVVARIALSEISPEWVAKNGIAHPNSLQAQRKLLLTTRSIAIISFLIRNELNKY